MVKEQNTIENYYNMKPNDKIQKYDFQLSFWNRRDKRSNDEKEEDAEDESESKETEKDDAEKKDKVNCDHKAKIDAFGGNYTLCLFLRHFKEEPIVRTSYDSLNISIFNSLNVSVDVSIETFDLYSAIGHVVEGVYSTIQF